MKLACARQLRELNDPPQGCFFDCDKANEICAFIETLPHVKGIWAKEGRTIDLEDWQCFLLTTAFGWMTAEGLRRFRTIYIEVPRKNAKSTIAAGVALYLFDKDAEAGSEVYTVATKRDQAKIVFDIARQMAVKAKLPDAAVFQHNLKSRRDGSIFAPLNSQSSTMDGLNVHGAINDELHAWKERNLYDVIDTATGSRSQPMIFNITTAGNNLEGVCYEINGYCRKVLEGAADDESFFGVIYTIDKDDDWADESTWIKANPNFGVSVSPLDLKRLAKRANELASEQTSFLNKRLNVWTAANEAWMPMRQYALMADASLKLEDFAGQDAWAGVDLASKNDISSLAFVFNWIENGKRHYAGIVRHYLPEFAVANAANKGIYDGWVRQGLITTMPGSQLNVDVVEQDTIKYANLFNLQSLGYDPGHNSTQYGLHMESELGLNKVVEVRPLVKHFSDPMKWLEAWVQDRTYHHNGCPVMTWMMSNVEIKRDHNDNIFPRKQAYERKIDGVVALLIAVNRALAADEMPIHDGGLIVL